MTDSVYNVYAADKIRHFTYPPEARYAGRLVSDTFSKVSHDPTIVTAFVEWATMDDFGNIGSLYFNEMYGAADNFQHAVIEATSVILVDDGDTFHFYIDWEGISSSEGYVGLVGIHQ